MFKSEQPRTLEEAADAVSSVVDSSAGFLDPIYDIPIVAYKIVEEELPWDLTDLGPRTTVNLLFTADSGALSTLWFVGLLQSPISSRSN